MNRLLRNFHRNLNILTLEFIIVPKFILKLTSGTLEKMNMLRLVYPKRLSVK